MKIHRLDAHDRYQHFTSQQFDIGTCCQNLIDQRPFGDYSFYIFAHARTIGLDEKVKLFASGHFKTIEEIPEKTIIWQPRLTKPSPQTNSMLFKVSPGSDIVKVIWIIPPREMWPQYEKGKLSESQLIVESIHDFQHNPAKLEQREEGDLTDETIKKIYEEISRKAKKDTKIV
jgi:hypothetical protein